MSPPIVKGWCPGAYKPMMSGDGLVVRVRPWAAEISKDQARVLAHLAQHYGNGFLDLTNRANIQIRGVDQDHFPKVLNALNDAQLLDVSPLNEARRNIVITPFWTEQDRSHQIYDALTAALPEFPDVPGKFGFVIDCGPTRLLQDVPGDIRFERAHDGGLIVRADGQASGVSVTVDTAILTAKSLAEWFTQKRRANVRRMRHLLDRETLPDQYQGTAAAACSKPAVPMLHAAFGKVSAKTLVELADGALGPIRITPWRAVVAKTDGQNIAGFETDDTAPVLKAFACSGRPYCPQSSVETRNLARKLAGKWPGTLHVSGCPKGCARPLSAEVVLVGRNGRFDLVRNGTAWDDPVKTGLDPNEIDQLDLK